ncbi:adenylate kinase [Fusarium sp. NRRL 25303]|nr:adenylate kinase [Fusarium sp. NRRL 25303]
MKLHAKSGDKSRSFAIMFIIGTVISALHLSHSPLLTRPCFNLGAPGAGKETLSAYLAQKYNLVHYSDLNPFIHREILDAFNRNEPEVRGILVDGYPRCIEQLDSFGTWPFQDTVPLAPSDDGKSSLVIKPDLVLSFQITEQNARARYLSRGRDTNDSSDKFEKRFTE